MTPQKKKILFFIATLAQGGAERLISELSFKLKLEGFEIVIVISEDKVSYPYYGKLVVLGVPLSGNTFLKIYRYFARFVRLWRVVLQEKPDYVVSFGAFANLLNVFLPSKVLLHTDAFYSEGRFRGTFLGFVLKLLARFFYNRAEKVIPMSYLAAQDLLDNYGVREEKVQMIYNVLPVRKIETLAAEPLEKDFQELFSRPVVITVGRLVQEKGQWHLIKAFRKLKEVVPDTKLVILGEGELKVALEELARGLGIVEDVHFLGWQDNPFRFFSRSAVFVLSSHTEGLPTVLLEAMACGLPVISADCKSGPREIVAPSSSIHKEADGVEVAEYGVLTPPLEKTFPFSKDLAREEEILADAMATLFEDHLLRKKLGENAKKRAEDFSMERILGDWRILFGCDKVGGVKARI